MLWLTRVNQSEPVAEPYGEEVETSSGAAGPDWTRRLRKALADAHAGGNQSSGFAAPALSTGEKVDAKPFPRRRLRVVTQCELGSLEPPKAGSVTTAGWPVTAQLSNGERLGVDLVVAAAGVDPCADWLPDSVCPRAAVGKVQA